MLSSTKLSESPRSGNIGLHDVENYSTINDKASGIHSSFTTPKITSTPVRFDMYATPPKPHVLSPRRYSLSDIATPPRITRKDPTSRSSFHHSISGPLLASTNINLNVSTYEETKSPGLARRIVQYNQETEREKQWAHPPTHQAKYGSFGLFPVVHLFKKDPPTLEQRPKRVKVRISSPDFARYNSEEYKLKLLEGIVKTKTTNNFSHGYQQHSAEASSSTRSVLDALKEISRKRIHASEEYDINEDSGKRQRTDFLNRIDSNKRTRDDSSSLLDSPTSPHKSISKRACMYDEYAASCSSTTHSLKKSELSGFKRKSISTSTLTENIKETKQVKLINAETQTISEEKDIPPSELEVPVNKSEESGQTHDEQLMERRQSPLKVFDDAPLERIRKNRLAALMGSLTGKDPVLTPKPTFSSILNGSTQKPESQDTLDIPNEIGEPDKPLVSILTTNKLPHKSDKHVHFNIPNIPRSTSNSEDSSIIFNTSPTLNLTTVTPADKKTVSSTPAPPSSPVSLKPTESAATTHDIGITLTNSTSSIQTVSSQDMQSKGSSCPNISLSVPSPFSSSSTNQIPFESSNPVTFGSSANASTLESSSASAPSPKGSNKAGGFKFNLSPTKTSFSTSSVSDTTNVLTFNKVSQPKEIEVSMGQNTTTQSSSAIPFTSKPTVGVITSASKGLTFETTTTASSTGPLSSSSAAPFKFAVFNSETTLKPQVGIASVISKSETTNTVATPTFSFGSTTTNSAPSVTTTVMSSSQANRAPSFSFESVKMTNNNAATISTSTFSFVAPKQIAATTASSSLANIGFGTVSSNSTVSNGCTTNTTASCGFASAVPSLGISKTHNGFGLPVPSNSFGISTSVGGFGSATNISSGFGTRTTAIGGFGNTTSNGNFGASGFGTKTSTTPTFGARNNSSEFGGFGFPNTTSEGFGTTNIPSGVFGTTSASIFVGKTMPNFTASTKTTTSVGFVNSSSTSSSFNNTNVPVFGQNNVSSSFGANTTASFDTNNTFNTTTTSSSVFGGSTGFGTPANNSTVIFGGSATTQSSGFGVSNTIFAPTSTVKPFGNTNTSTSPSFGANTTSVFSFGAKTTTAIANGFGTNSTPSGGFGSTATPPFAVNNTFGGSSTNFGTSSTPNFAATTTQSGGFGTQIGGYVTPSQGFVSENKTVFGNTTIPGTNTSVFGSATAPTSFGTSNNPTTFGATTSNPAFGKPQNNAFVVASSNNFGTTAGGFVPNQAQATSPFGNPTVPATNSVPVFNFGSGVAAKQGVFSFGSASASGETMKPSFGFSGGSGASSFGASSFGGAGASSFGAPGASHFGPQQGASQGMFSIGSGSPSIRNRTMIRAKRKT